MAEVMTISAKQNFPMLLNQATMIQGWALAEQGHAAEAIAQIRQGLAGWKAMGHEAWKLLTLLRRPPRRRILASGHRV